METKKYCPECGHEFKQGESDFNYDTADTVCTCPECGWEGAAPLDDEEEEGEEPLHEAMVIEARRTDYSVDQVLSSRSCMTVGNSSRCSRRTTRTTPRPLCSATTTATLTGRCRKAASSSGNSDRFNGIAFDTQGAGGSETVRLSFFHKFPAPESGTETPKTPGKTFPVKSRRDFWINPDLFPGFIFRFSPAAYVRHDTRIFASYSKQRNP